MNIAVFWPNWIGDAVMATPAVRALRQHYNGAKIVGVLKPYIAGTLEGAPWMDHQVLIKGSGLATAAQLRRHSIDLSVLFPNSFRSALISWIAGSRRRVGFARHGRSWLLTDRLEPRRDAEGNLVPAPIIDDYNRLAVQAGCGNVDRKMQLFTTPKDEAAADRVWQAAGLYEFKEVVCLNTGAAFGAAKHWPTEYFAKLARQLAHKRLCSVLVLSGPAERELAREIVRQALSPLVHRLGAEPPSLGLTKALIRRSSLLVTTDSGPRHMAAAFDRPVLTLFGPTHIAWTETYYAKAVHLQKEVDCGPCQLRVCPLDHRCMKLLSPEEVFQAACRLLDDEAAAGPLRRVG